MFGLSSLLPLETLPGWPEAPNPSVVDALYILVGVPGAISLVILALVVAPSWFRRGESSTDVVKA